MEAQAYKNAREMFETFITYPDQTQDDLEALNADNKKMCVHSAVKWGHPQMMLSKLAIFYCPFPSSHIIIKTQTSSNMRSGTFVV